jgi:hypothetical protein
MTKKLTWILAAGAIALLASCSDDTKGTTKKDKGTPTPEQTITLPEGGTPDKTVTNKEGGGSLAGWGDVCNTTTACTNKSMVCAGTSSTAGFCTMTCTNSPGECPGYASGQIAMCLLSDGKTPPTVACGFLCLLQGKSYTCPGQLKCDTVENPPGSGQKFCVAP